MTNRSVSKESLERKLENRKKKAFLCRFLPSYAEECNVAMKYLPSFLCISSRSRSASLLPVVPLFPTFVPILLAVECSYNL